MNKFPEATIICPSCKKIRKQSLQVARITGALCRVCRHDPKAVYPDGWDMLEKWLLDSTAPKPTVEKGCKVD